MCVACFNSEILHGFLYSQLPLPDPDHSLYVVELLYIKWTSKSHLKIDAYVYVFNENWSGKQSLDSYFVHAWGKTKILYTKMTLIDRKSVV